MVWASALTKFGCPAGSRASGLVVKGLVACPPAAGAASPSLKGLHKRGEAIAAGRPACLSVFVKPVWTHRWRCPARRRAACLLLRAAMAIAVLPTGAALAAWLLVSGKKSPEPSEPWEHRYKNKPF